MTKCEARILYKAKRAELTDKELLVYQDLLLIHFQELNLPYIDLIHTYLPIYENNEPDPSPLTDWLRFTNPGLKVTYSAINPSDYSMKHFLQHDDMTFKTNQYGIPEPIDGTEISENEIDIAIIPLLAVDIHGNRVGYGKGYYDRFISKCRQDLIKIGLSFFPPVESIDDVDFFDKKLDFCITPECVYAF